MLTTAGILGKGPKEKALLLPLQVTDNGVIEVRCSRVGRGRSICLQRKVWRPLNFSSDMQIILTLLILPCRDYAEKNMAEKDDNKASILSTLDDIENSGFDVLLQQLFAQLKVPYPHPTPSCPTAQPVPGTFSCCALGCPNFYSNAAKFRRAAGQVRSPLSISQKPLDHLSWSWSSSHQAKQVQVHRHDCADEHKTCRSHLR